MIITIFPLAAEIELALAIQWYESRRVGLGREPIVAVDVLRKHGRSGSASPCPSISGHAVNPSVSHLLSRRGDAVGRPLYTRLRRQDDDTSRAHLARWVQYL